MKSLKDIPIENWKKEISNILNVKKENIKFFGSRINGDYTEESDLDVAIKGKCPKKWKQHQLILNGINVELHWMEDFNISWLINSI